MVPLYIEIKKKKKKKRTKQKVLLDRRHQSIIIGDRTYFTTSVLTCVYIYMCVCVCVYRYHVYQVYNIYIYINTHTSLNDAHVRRVPGSIFVLITLYTRVFRRPRG